jgi:hypothetical protein
MLFSSKLKNPMPPPHNHGSSDNLIKYIKTRSDDIDAIWIVFDNAMVTTNVDGSIDETRDVAAVIQYCDGSTSMIHAVDTELVLNDEGIRRLRIPFRLLLPGRSLPQKPTGDA